jgi:enoyl-CoA hydratase/carnithine racemase
MDVGVTQQDLVLREDRGAVAWLTLNRPDKANALSRAMLSALHGQIEAAAADPAIRVLVIAAAGRIFCAGHDLNEVRAHDDPEWQAALFAQCSGLMLLLQRVEKPVVACVQGAAVAAGCQLVASCDLAYAATGARFGVSGINLGLFCSTPAVAVSRAMGRKAAMELLLSGRLIEADEARRLGLVNDVVAPDELGTVVARTAAVIADKLPAAVGMGKSLFYRQLGLAPDEAYALAGQTMVANLGLPATTACIDGFLAKASR